MRAGFSEIEIAPPLGFVTAGMPAAEPASEVKWSLYARAAVLDDGEQRAAVVVLDVVALEAKTVQSLRRAIAAKVDIECGNILISCTHTHSAPSPISFLERVAATGFVQLLHERLPQAVAAAVDALEPATLLFGQAQTRGLAFNRRPMYADGEVGTQGPRTGDFVGPEGPVDDELQVLAAARPDGSLVGGLVHFACHPTVMGHQTAYSADFPGALAEELARRHGCPFLFLQGAAGNVNWYDSTPPQLDMPAAVQKTEAIAADLAEATNEALASARPVGDRPMGVSSRTIRIEERRPTLDQIALARWFLEQDPASVDQEEFTRRITGHRFTFHANRPEAQAWFCRMLLSLAEWQATHDGTPTEDVEIQALAIGDVAIVGFPAEMFAEFGLELKRLSPFGATFPCNLTNGSVGYVPTERAFEHGGYETRLGYQSRLAVDAGARMVGTALELFNDLFATPTAEGEGVG